MKILLPTALLLFLACTVVRGEGNTTTNNVPPGVKHPTKPGTYVMGEWTYVYGITGKGSRSERRMGNLFHHGFPVSGHAGQIKSTPFGNFAYLEGAWWSPGWVNALTDDKPIFDQEGNLMPGMSKLLNDMQAAKRRQEEQNKNLEPISGSQ